MALWIATSTDSLLDNDLFGDGFLGDGFDDVCTLCIHTPAHSGAHAHSGSLRQASTQASKHMAWQAHMPGTRKSTHSTVTHTHTHTHRLHLNSEFRMN